MPFVSLSTVHGDRRKAPLLCRCAAVLAAAVVLAVFLVFESALPATAQEDPPHAGPATAQEDPPHAGPATAQEDPPHGGPAAAQEDPPHAGHVLRRLRSPEREEAIRGMAERDAAIQAAGTQEDRSFLSRESFLEKLSTKKTQPSQAPELQAPELKTVLPTRSAKPIRPH
jgi:hypothetical protein